MITLRKVRVLTAGPFMAAVSVLAVTHALAQPQSATTPSAVSAPAPASPSSVPEEIVVTAQKRTEKLQDVPIAITALSPAKLAKTNIEAITDLVKVTPGFTVGRLPQVANTRLNIRGIGTAGRTAIEPSVATFLDDVYIPRPGAIIGNFYDVSDIDILRGPQGTLFGRNSTAGAISVHTNQPTPYLSGYTDAEYGSYGHYKVDGAVNVPVSNDLAIRVAGIATGFNGFAVTSDGNHRYGDQHTYAGRFSAKYTPSAAVTWLVRADYQKTGGDGASDLEILPSTLTPTAIANLTKTLGGQIPQLSSPFNHRSDSLIYGNLNDRQYGVSSDLKVDVGSGYAFRLIDAYRNWKDDQLDGDLIGSPVNLVGRQAFFTSESQSHELQFISPKRGLLDGHFDFVSGLYFTREVFATGEALNNGSAFCSVIIAKVKPSLVNACNNGPALAATGSDFHQVAESLAAYGQGTFSINDQLALTGGGRYTHDRKSATFVQTVANSADLILRAPESDNLFYSQGKFTYRINGTYKPSSHVMFFATYATGYKSGGFNSENGAAVLGQQRKFGPETIDDIEAGIKADVFDRALTFDLTGFRMMLHGLQDRGFDGLSATVTNAGNLRQQGAEFQATLHPSGGFLIDAAVAYLNSDFTYYPTAAALPAFTGTQNLAGKPNNYSPKWQGDLGLEYSHSLFKSDWKIDARSDLSFISSENVGSVTDANPQTIQKGYAILGANITFTAPGNRLTVGVFGSNLTDKGYCTYIMPVTLDSVLGLRNPATGGTVMRCAVGDPRTVGARIGYKF